jgi:hypothetical protein
VSSVNGAHAELLRRADACERDGRLLEAIDALTAANRQARDSDVERRLVDVRNRAMAELAARGRDIWPPVVAEQFDVAPGVIPEVAARELTADGIASGITHHGSIIVRDLVPPETVELLREDIRRAFAGRDAFRKQQEPPADVAAWFVPFVKGREQAESFGNASYVRAIDSPPTLFDLIDAYTTNGLLALIEAHLGERPAVSANKCALRCIAPVDAQFPGGGFHQDGAFLGEGIRALNVWLALSDCGGDAAVPGLDVVPRRLPDVLPTGTEGSMFPWSTSGTVVDEARGDLPIVRPTFAAGDALLFDELLLHCTGKSPGMSAPRYAIECWCFAPSRYPPKHVPVVL